jgi:hypothetical protein
MSIASDFQARTEVTNNLHVIDTLPVVSFSVLDQSTNYLPLTIKWNRQEEIGSTIHQRADHTVATTDRSHCQRGG